MIIKNPKSGQRYFYYSRDNSDTIAVTDEQDITEIYTLKDGKFTLTDTVKAFWYAYKDLNCEDVYGTKEVLAIGVNEDGHLETMKKNGRYYLKCLKITFGPTVKYKEKYIELGGSLKSCRQYSELEFGLYYTEKEARNNNRYIYTMICDMIDMFPYLHLAESLWNKTEDTIRNNHGIFKTISLEEILVHKYYYDTNPQYKDMVDRGLGFIASCSLRHDRVKSGCLVLDNSEEGEFTKLCNAVKGKKFEDIPKELREQVWSTIADVSLTGLLLLNNFTEIEIEIFINIIGRRYQNYLTYQQLLYYIPQDASIDEALNYFCKALRAGELYFRVDSDLLRLLNMVNLTVPIEDIRKTFSLHSYSDWDRLGRESKAKDNDRKRGNIKNTFCIKDYRSGCILNGDIGDDFKIKFVQTADDLSYSEMDYLIDHFSNLSKNEVIYRISDKNQRNRTAFMVLDLKTSVIQFFDVTQEGGAYFKEAEIIECRSFLYRRSAKFHNLYLVNHDLI